MVCRDTDTCADILARVLKNAWQAECLPGRRLQDINSP